MFDSYIKWYLVVFIPCFFFYSKKEYIFKYASEIEVIEIYFTFLISLIFVFVSDINSLFCPTPPPGEWEMLSVLKRGLWKVSMW